MKFVAFIIQSILFLQVTLSGNGQEVLCFPGENPAVQKAYKSVRHLKSLTALDTLNLPFFDDFSRNTVYPDASLWTDKEAFVNFTYAIDPISIGVATLDAIDESGAIYPQASHLTFEADHLTSKPINLELSPGDGVFFSFYYQPQGIADPPEPSDSLILMFYAALQQRWVTVWHHAGDTLLPFKEVMIPVTDTAFLHNGFRFMFKNLASLSSNPFDPGRISNCDQWNIDYVLLDKSRFANDTLPRDVAFSRPLQSLLKSYEAMPWKHFRETFLTEMGSNFPITYRNNDSIVRNVTREFRITDLYTDQTVHSFSGGASNAPADSEITYNAPLIYTFNSSQQDSALFELKSYLITDDFDPKINDTIIRYQVFGNEFAYDDGTAEAGYGLSGNGMENAALACKFHAYLPDTLSEIRIWFNHSKDDANLTDFNLVVWNDSSNVPGAVIYRQEGVFPVLQNNMAGFVTFPLDTTLVINGDFYVGWEQVSTTFLNVGFDLNLDHHIHSRIFTSGVWSTSSFPGSIMIRPVFGKDIVTGTESPPDELSAWNFYPNPANQFIYLQRPFTADQSNTLQLRMYTLTGRMVLGTRLSGDRIDVSALANGVYLMVLSDKQKVLVQSKVIIMH